MWVNSIRSCSALLGFAVCALAACGGGADPAGEAEGNSEAAVSGKSTSLAGPVMGFHAFYVNAATGSDMNPCSAAAPCKTIQHAASGAPAGSTVILADGVYDPTTQISASLPDGVGLLALHPGAATIAAFYVTAAGSSAISGVVFDQKNFVCGGVIAQATTGTPMLALNGVLMKCMGAVQVGGQVAATMRPGTLPGGVYTAALPDGSGMVTVKGNATLLVDGGAVDGNGTGAPVFGAGLFAVLEHAVMTFSNVTMHDRTGTGISVAGPARLVLEQGTELDAVGVAGNCAVGSSVVVSGAASVEMDHVQISHSPNAALCVRNGVAPAISLVQSTMSANHIGIGSEIGSGSAVALKARGLNLAGNDVGINWGGVAGTSFDLTTATISGNRIGVQIDAPAGIFKLRRSLVTGNLDAGIVLFNNVQVDLGTQPSPGLNTFTGNVNAGVRANLIADADLAAVGNTWNAGAQGADGAGHYSVPPLWTPVSLTGPTGSGPGFNVVLPAHVSASL